MLLERVRAASLRVWPLSTVTHAYYGLRFWEPVWRDLINRRAHAAPPPLDRVQERVLGELRTAGIASVPVDELLGEPGAFRRLAAAAGAVIDRPAVQAQLAAGQGGGSRGKQYLIRALDPDRARRPRFDPDEPLQQLAVAPRVLAVARAYFGFLPRLKSYDLWINLPDTATARSGSQVWHRDYEDRNLLKIFLYLNDVDAGAGPLSFVRTSQIGGALGKLFPRRPPIGVVPGDDEVDRKVPHDLMTTCTVPAGTLVLCDTTGLHKGGRCERSRRIAFTATYASQGAIDRDRYTVDPALRQRALAPEVRYALGLEP